MEAEEYETPVAPTYHHTSEGALKTHIDSEEIISSIQRSLRCEIPLVDKNGQIKWVTPQGVSPIINNQGLRRVEAILRSRLNKIFIFSDLEKENINNITTSIGQNIIDSIMFNWDVYGINDPADASIVVQVVTDTVYATLRKGYMGNYLKFLRTTSQIQEVQHHSLSGVQKTSNSPLDFFKNLPKAFGGKK